MTFLAHRCCKEAALSSGVLVLLLCTYPTTAHAHNRPVAQNLDRIPSPSPSLPPHAFLLDGFFPLLFLPALPIGCPPDARHERAPSSWLCACCKPDSGAFHSAVQREKGVCVHPYRTVGPPRGDFLRFNCVLSISRPHDHSERRLPQFTKRAQRVREREREGVDRRREKETRIRREHIRNTEYREREP